MIKLTEILSELYSNPICPRKEGESDEEYKQRCAPLMGPSVLLNLGSVGEEIEKFDRVEYYKKYYENLSPSDFNVKIEGNGIKVDLPTVDEKSKGKLRPADILKRKRAMAGKKLRFKEESGER
jgi:hypothetical protein